MSVRVEGAIRTSDLVGPERDFLEALKRAVDTALKADVDPNHILSMLSGVFVKSAVAMGMPLDKLDDLVEGVRLTIEAERTPEVPHAEAN